jgi:hypothetical protein
VAALGCGPHEGTPARSPAQSTAEPSASPPRVDLPAGAPALILFLVIDQGSEDQIERWRPLLDGGLGRLLDESAWFTDARQNHAVTETSPGHATLATGREPRSHGIIANDWVDPESGEDVYSVADPDVGRSPRNLRGDALGDWLHRAVPGSKVFSVSGKDRAAILLGGRHPDGVLWYDRSTGRFVSSEYYPWGESGPAWLASFYRDHPPTRRFGSLWKPLPEVAARAPALGAASVDLGAVAASQAFPHALGGLELSPGPAYFADLYRSPFGDAYVAELAETLIAEEDLGRDRAPDLLAVSFSSLDAVGHRYGPDSLEYADTLARLDRSLGGLLDMVDRRVGLDRTLVVLSADHGVDPAPEVAAGGGGTGRRAGARDALCFQRVEAGLETELGPATWLHPGPFIDRQAVAAHHLELSAVEDDAAKLLERCPAVARVWTRDELEGPLSPSTPFAELFSNAFDAQRSPDLMIQLQEDVLAANPPVVATHGSPYPYDTRVPWLLRGTGIAAHRIATRVSAADVAPTVAALVGIPVPPGLDGSDREAALGRK